MHLADANRDRLRTDFADNDVDGTQGIDPNQLIDTYVAPPKFDSQYIVGSKPGPYVAEHSVNIYTRLGARIALLGIDARTEVRSGLQDRTLDGAPS